jgi:hypothetical protein
MRWGRNALRWQRPLGAAQLDVDVGHLAWTQHRVLEGSIEDVSEGRTNAAVDLTGPMRGHWSGAVRSRWTSTSGDRFAFPDTLRAARDRADLQLEANRNGRVRTGVTGGAHHLEGAGWEWSGAAHASVTRGVWELGAHAGRGVSFAGWGEPDPVAARTANSGSVHLRRTAGPARLSLEAFGKSLHGGNAAARFFPATHGGPTRVGGLLGEATWRGVARRSTASLTAAVAWLPELRGDPAGEPELQGRFDLRASRSLRGGDLVLTLLTTWRLDTERAWAAAPSIAPSAWGDGMFDVMVLQRANFFVGMSNLTDAAIETYPGVFLPSRLYWFGVRVRLID